MEPTRQIYWNIHNEGYVYVFMAIALVFFTAGLFNRVLVWQLGQKEHRTDNIKQRLWTLLSQGFGQKRILREPFPGLMHGALFYGFLILGFGTVVIALQEDLKISIFNGDFYLGLSVLMDIFGFIALLGSGVAIYRRYFKKAAGLDNKVEDGIVLALIFSILLTGFLVESLRIYAANDQWPLWSPVGYLIAKTLEAIGLTKGFAQIGHRYLWWIHMFLAFGFIAYLPFSKLMHIIVAPINQFTRNLEAGGGLKALDLNNEEIENFGVSNIQEFTWKQLMDTEACLRCGRCQEHCPAYLSEKPLSPKQLTQDLREHLNEKAKLLINLQKKTGPNPDLETLEKACLEEGPKALETFNKALIGEVVTKDTLWSCTTCRSCEEQCPVFAEHVGKIVDMRRNLVLMESDFPSEVMVTFRNLEKNGNPWGIGWNKRNEWAQELEVPEINEKSNVDILYWVGCAGSFDERNKKVSQAVIKILEKTGVSFAIIGAQEKCCGDSARRLGNEYLFQMLAKENIETLKQYNFKTILTHCPHCFNTLKNEYPQFGGDFKVIHHTEFIKNQIAGGKLRFTKALEQKVTYHDSCYLGRYNNIFDAPREILKAINGLELIEFKRNKTKSFCCGAGGGRMWIEENLGKRINVMRTEEAKEGGSDIISTACPFCLTMMADGTKILEADAKLETLDLAEIVEKVI